MARRQTRLRKRIFTSENEQTQNRFARAIQPKFDPGEFQDADNQRVLGERSPLEKGGSILQRIWERDNSGQIGDTVPMSQLGIQAKLTVESSDTSDEHDADDVAARVSASIRSSDSGREPSIVERKPSSLQRDVMGADGAEVSSDFERELNQQKRSGGESLSENTQNVIQEKTGWDTKNMKIHRYAKANALSKAIQAKAFTTDNHIFYADSSDYGKDIESSSKNQQELLMHEITHGNQQGAIQQYSNTVQRRSHEDKNSSLPSNSGMASTIQCKSKGGIEYTEENGKNVLHHIAGTTNGFDDASNLLGHSQLGDDGMSFFSIDKVQYSDIIGSTTNTDEQVLQQGNVKLENDVQTAEWIVEGHHGSGTDLDEMMQDINVLFSLRTGLKNQIEIFSKQLNVTDQLVFTPTDNVEGANLDENLDTNMTQEDALEAMFGSEMDLDETAAQENVSPGLKDKNLLFEYPKIAPESKGSAQITFKYSNKETIDRINEFNLAKYLKGGPIQDPVEYLGKRENAFFKKNRPSQIAPGAYAVNKTLKANSQPLIFKGFTVLAKEDVGRVKMMIMNDAMAVMMSRFNAAIGQSADKNRQSFLPKSRRPHYVHSLAGGTLPDGALVKLRQKLSDSIPRMIEAFMSQLDIANLNRQDFNAILSDLETNNKQQDAEKLREIQIKLGAKDQASLSDLDYFMKMVFGVNNAFLVTRLGEVINAYTETTGQEAHLLDNGNRLAVIKSTGDFASVDSDNDPGAVYEMRKAKGNKEIPMGEKNLGPIRDALAKILAQTEE